MVGNGQNHVRRKAHQLRRVGAHAFWISTGPALDVSGLTNAVIDALKEENAVVVQAIRQDIETKSGASPNIEAVLSRIRLLTQAIGKETVHGYDSSGYETLGKMICELIGSKVGAKLPNEPNAYTELVSWVGGTTV